MPSIHTIQSRDVQFLADTFSKEDYDYFNTLHIDQLQDKSRTWIVHDVDEYDDLIYLGYTCVQWQSDYTAFWRRNIPEIVVISVSDDILSEMLKIIEAIARERGHQKVGIRVDSSDEQLYQSCGYIREAFAQARGDTIVLNKTLT